jgi:hypothetical protein
MVVSVRVGLGLGHGLQCVTFGRAGQHHRTVPDRDVRSSVTHDMTSWIYHRRLPVTAAIWLGSPTHARAAAALRVRVRARTAAGSQRPMMIRGIRVSATVPVTVIIRISRPGGLSLQSRCGRSRPRVMGPGQISS